MKNERNFLAILWVILGTAGRLIPHLPNATPLTAIALFSGSQLGKVLSFVVALSTMILSDLALAKIYGYPAFGLWSFFTYSGFIAIIFAGTFLKEAGLGRTFGFLLASSLGYWLWTNFGIWATGDHGLYPATFEGLVACYVAALPFLRNALIGDLVWGAALFFSFYGVRKFVPGYAVATQN